eukprot:TRINITY_DN22407_c0_g1_i1.p1 TRINITY_DN22407_c0_g1~~TRINITY_DN22407_c0_g1_i1.p1  ORF type:complete len:650 (-),score=89.80 TRINITY_DN22407_c0_g1_i1:247-2127(-)
MQTVAFRLSRRKSSLVLNLDDRPSWFGSEPVRLPSIVTSRKGRVTPLPEDPGSYLYDGAEPTPNGRSHNVLRSSGSLPSLVGGALSRAASSLLNRPRGLGDTSNLGSPSGASGRSRSQNDVRKQFLDMGDLPGCVASPKNPRPVAAGGFPRPNPPKKQGSGVGQFPSPLNTIMKPPSAVLKGRSPATASTVAPSTTSSPQAWEGWAPAEEAPCINDTVISSTSLVLVGDRNASRLDGCVPQSGDTALRSLADEEDAPVEPVLVQQDKPQTPQPVYAVATTTSAPHCQSTVDVQVKTRPRPAPKPLPPRAKSRGNGGHCSSSSSDTMSWRKGEEIGHGSYGSVYMAQDKQDGHVFAVKVARFDINDEHEKQYCEKLTKELDIIKDLRHRHIVSCLGHEYLDGCLCIFLEYVAGGCLRKQIKDFGPLEGTLLAKAARGMLRGLSYLHSLDPPVVHRDVKCANVLVDLKFCVKLTDFGCSKQDIASQSFTTVGSVYWMAPEVIHLDGGHGRKADIWSYACTFIEMASADEPWGKGAFDNIMQAAHCIAFSNKLPPIPSTLPQVAQDFVLSCLIRDPAARPTPEELLMHPFVQSPNKESKDAKELGEDARGDSRCTSRAASRATSRRSCR